MTSTAKKLFDTKCFRISRSLLFAGAAFSFCAFIESLTGRSFDPIIFTVFALVLAVLAFFADNKLYALNGGAAKICFTFFSAVLCVFSLLFFTESSKSLLWVILFACIAAFFNNSFSLETTEKISTVSFVLGAFFSLLILLGRQLSVFERLDFLYLSDKSMQQIFQPFSRLSYLVFLFYILLVRLLSAAVNRRPCAVQDKRDGKANNLLTFFLCMAVIFLCWLPYYLSFYPGVISEDSLSEILQQLGKETLSNHHPLIHQFFIGLCLRSADTLTKGVARYSIVQILFLASAFSTAVVYLKKRGANTMLLLGVLAVYALFPVNAFFSITMWKDIPFAASSVFLTVLLLKETEGKAPRPIGSAVLFILAAFGFCTFRNNGFYAFLFGMLLMILFNRNIRKRLLVLSLIVVCLVTGYQHILFHTIGAARSNVAEALSVPMQQIARVLKMDGIDDEDENIAVLREVFPDMEQTAANYTPTFADSVKGNPKRGYALFDDETFKADPLRYIKSWMGLGIKHPLKYTEAFLLQSYGYWYPDVNVDVVASYIVENDLGLKQTDRFENLKEGLYLGSQGLIRHQPTAVFTGIGFLVWVLLLCGVILCLKGQGKTASVLFVMLGLWLTTLLSPVYCEYRYIYGLIVIVPLYAAITISTENMRNVF